MQGKILNIQRYCVHDGPGIRTTIFLKGCPLSCLWCSNPTTQNINNELGFEKSKCFGCGTCMEICPELAISFDKIPVIDREKCTLCGKCTESCKGTALKILGESKTVEELVKAAESDMVFYRSTGGGVTLSGGEILMQAEFSRAVLAECQKRGLNTAIETSCFAPFEKLQTVAEYSDCIMADIKHLDSEIHKKITGVPNELILENIKKLTSLYPQTLIRIPLIPNLNTDNDHIIRLAKFVSELAMPKVELLPYHALGESKYATIGRKYSLTGSKLQPEHLQRIVELFRANTHKSVLCTA